MSGDNLSEKASQNKALVGLSAIPNSLYYRNNTGTAWQGRQHRARVGELVRVEPGMRILRDARPISFGLEGSGDIMGTTAGRAVAVEMKTLTGPQRVQQEKFEANWTKAGGLYVLARSDASAVHQVLSGALFG